MAHTDQVTVLTPEPVSDPVGALPPPALPSSTRRRRLSPALLVAAAIAGVALVVLGMGVLDALIVMARAAITVVGAVLFVWALGRLIKVWRGERTDSFQWLAAIWLGLLSVAAIVADFLPMSEATDPSEAMLAPSRAAPDLFSAHPLGTDTVGLDVLGQVVYGARVSIVVALGAVLIAATIGGVLGLLAGFFRGRVESVVTFVADVVLSFPPLILLLALVTILDANLLNLTVALGFIVVPSFIRLSRANTIKVASSEYVVAARVIGTRRSRVLIHEILPNVVPSLVAYSFIMMGILVVAEASLSFLGLGVQRPTPTWGNIIAQGEQYLQSSPHLVLAPAFFLFLTVLSANYIGQNLQRKWGI